MTKVATLNTIECETTYSPITADEFCCGDWNYEESNKVLMLTLRGYFDDSADGRRERFVACGGLVGAPQSWDRFDRQWLARTRKLSAPFHSTDCEARQGAFKGWSHFNCKELMRDLVSVIDDSKLAGFASVVPVSDYKAVFPMAAEKEPYFLALKHTLINMAKVAHDIAARMPEFVEMKVCHEDGDESVEAFRIWNEIRRIKSWGNREYLTAFSTASKRLMALQGADLLAREAFKFVDNLGKREIRKPIQRLKDHTCFIVWNRECLDHLRSLGGQDNLEALTSWQELAVPVMPQFYREGFGRVVE